MARKSVRNKRIALRVLQGTSYQQLRATFNLSTERIRQVFFAELQRVDPTRVHSLTAHDGRLYILEKVQKDDKLNHHFQSLLKEEENERTRIS